MSITDIPSEIRGLYEIHEWRNAIAVLAAVHPQEWKEILTVLSSFRLMRKDIVKRGGPKSDIARKLDSHFYEFGWKEKQFSTKIVVDDVETVSPTHKVDCFKNKVALEIEWNNKDTFFDRDLNNFRLLFELRAIDAGVIVTRSDNLTPILHSLRESKSYGTTTTHIGQLIPRIEGGGGGGCPVLAFGITREAYVED
jgi:hypothetical protein